jgi:hypothetical protein
MQQLLKSLPACSPDDQSAARRRRTSHHAMQLRLDSSHAATLPAASIPKAALRIFGHSGKQPTRAAWLQLTKVEASCASKREWDAACRRRAITSFYNANAYAPPATKARRTICLRPGESANQSTRVESSTINTHTHTRARRRTRRREEKSTCHFCCLRFFYERVQRDFVFKKVNLIKLPIFGWALHPPGPPQQCA